MVANDDAGNLIPHGVLRLIASKLAPTRVISVLNTALQAKPV
jgi:hypothetical protein